MLVLGSFFYDQEFFFLEFYKMDMFAVNAVFFIVTNRNLIKKTG